MTNRLTIVLLNMKYISLSTRKCLITILTLVVFAATVRADEICKYSDRGWAFNKSSASVGVCPAKFLVKKPQKVVIAVIDTGVDFNHPLLTKNLVSDKQKERGLSSLPFPDQLDKNGHGTHISGIISNFGKSIFGAEQDPFTIISVKLYDNSDWAADQTVAAIRYAIERGAKIINISAGGPGFNQPEFAAFQEAARMGVLVVAAAGNDAQMFSDKYSFYPAAYKLPNIISVASLEESGQLLPSSNWGMGVDVAAPGRDILSSHAGGGYSFMSGTSQATAFVTGVAAVLLSQNPRLTAVELKELIESSVRKRKALAGKIKTGGQIDIDRALIKLMAYRRPNG